MTRPPEVIDDFLSERKRYRAYGQFGEVVLIACPECGRDVRRINAGNRREPTDGIHERCRGCGASFDWEVVMEQP